MLIIKCISWLKLWSTPSHMYSSRQSLETNCNRWKTFVKPISNTIMTMKLQKEGLVYQKVFHLILWTHVKKIQSFENFTLPKLTSFVSRSNRTWKHLAKQNIRSRKKPSETFSNVFRVIHIVISFCMRNYLQLSKKTFVFNVIFLSFVMKNLRTFTLFTHWQLSDT